MNKEFKHQHWCDLTCQKFREKEFSEEHLKRIAKSISLLKGTRETILELQKRGIKLYILSGSVKQIIRIVLGKVYDCFEEVRANNMVLDEQGMLSKIEGTPFDFEGKAHFLKRLCDESGFPPPSVLFVGNSMNDSWARSTGVRTLCVNPHFTVPSNRAIWTDAIRTMEQMNEILQFVR